MDILILYRSYRVRERRTLMDHLRSFSRYGVGCRFVYLDVGNIFSIPRSIAEYPFDAVIFHFLFLGYRIDRQPYERLYKRIGGTLQRLHGTKVMMPQDAYLCTDALWQLIRDCDVDRVYACCTPRDYDTIYPPDKVGKTDLLRTVMPGYVDERLQKKIDRMRRHEKTRTYDIGYRALQSSYIFGKHGYLKTAVAKAFSDACRNRPDLNTDIRMTGDGYRNVLVGNDWLRYLLHCRATLGCLGGSSLLDPDGSLRARTLAYVAVHPDASYEEVAENCFPGQDGRIAEYDLGPRHFECAMTKTCQLLVEGDYHGVLQAGRDYIEIKRDFSNVGDVLDAVADGTTCERIAEQCYRDVVASGKYTYRAFVNMVIEDIRSLRAAEAPCEGQSGLRIARMRAAAALIHAVNQCRNAAVNTAKACVARFTKNNPALYERIKRWYKHI